MLWSRVSSAVLGGRRALVPANLGYAPNPVIPRGMKLGVEDDVRHVLGSVPTDIEALHVVGHSYGAMVALHVIEALGERVRSAFLYEPVLFGALSRADALDPAAAAELVAFQSHPWFIQDESRGGGEEWLAHFIDYWNRPGSWAKMPEPLREATRAVSWKMFQEVRSCFFDTKPFEAWRLPPRTTLARGERSPAASRAMTQALALGRPAVTVVDLPKVGHMAPLTHASVTDEALAAHFARIDGNVPHDG